MLNGLVNTRDVMKLWYFIQQRNVTKLWYFIQQRDVTKLVFRSATIVLETSNINGKSVYKVYWRRGTMGGHCNFVPVYMCYCP